MELNQQLVQELSAYQIENLKLLQLNTTELVEYLAQTALENPMIDLNRLSLANTSVPSALNAPDNEQIFRNRIEYNDYYDFKYCDNTEYYDPFLFAGNGGGLQETLQKHLFWQIDKLNLDNNCREILRYLVALLDSDGYLRMHEDQILKLMHIQQQEYFELLKLLQSLNPVGVGARSLNECIAIQLKNLGESSLSCDIVMNHLEDLVRYRYNKIARFYHVDTDFLFDLRAKIEQTNPRPGSIFEQDENVPFVEPDIIIKESSGTFDAFLAHESSQFFSIDPQYIELMRNTKDSSLKQYLSDKLLQFNSIKYGLTQRENTLIKCAELILSKQSTFFLDNKLCPLTMSDIANELGLTTSTVSRAVRNKYIYCSKGFFPLRYFFAHSAEKEGGEVSNTTVKDLLKQMIQNEDKEHPLSDQKISESLSFRGCSISRRTVAKYRMELNIPGASGRRRS